MSTTTPLPADTRPAPPAPRRRWPLVAAAVAVVLAAALALVVATGTAAGVTRVDDPVDIGFAHDMKTHHAQAVEMSAILHERSPDREITDLALDIITTQQGQIGIMTGWLDLWDQPQAGAGPVMAWMEGHDGGMPGMATNEQIAALKTLPVEQMHEQYLRLMIRHHRGAIPMAGYAADHAVSPEMSGLAAGMENGQGAEIELMQQMLEDRGFAREPEAHAGH